MASERLIGRSDKTNEHGLMDEAKVWIAIVQKTST